MRNLIHDIAHAAVGTVLLLSAGWAGAQSYPAKPIMIKVAYPAGFGVDASVRPAAPIMQGSLGQNLVIDNMPGANGSIAAMNVLNAQPDGYTLLATAGADLLVAPMTVASAKYTVDSFKLVGVFGASDMVLVTPPSAPFKTLNELVEHMRKPGIKELSISHWGTGTLGHLAAADFQARVGAKLLEVPYKGIAPVAMAIASGEVDLAFVPLAGPIVGMVQTGRIKAIAVAGVKRNPVLPEVSLMNENAQFKNFELSIWAALFAPARTPDAVVARLSKAMDEWLNSAENLERTKAAGANKLDSMTPQQASTFLRSENEKYIGIAKSLKLVAQ